MCIFIDKWHCKFAGEEITLDICKTCISARRLHSETKHDRTLQKGMNEMKKQQKKTKGYELSGIEEKELPGYKEKDNGESQKTDEKGVAEKALEKVPSSKDDDESILDFLEEEIYGETSKDYRERLEPMSIVEKRNFEGELGDIRNNPLMPSDRWMMCDGEEGGVRITFPNPPGKLEPGKDTQEFLIRVKRTKNTSHTLPEVNVKVCESDVIIGETGMKEVKDVHGDTISLKWNAKDLQDVYGTDVEMIIECVNPEYNDGKNYVGIGGVEWRASVVENKSSQNEDLDEGAFFERLVSSSSDEGEEDIETISSDLNL